MKVTRRSNVCWSSLWTDAEFSCRAGLWDRWEHLDLQASCLTKHLLLLRRSRGWRDTEKGRWSHRKRKVETEMESSWVTPYEEEREGKKSGNSKPVDRSLAELFLSYCYEMNVAWSLVHCASRTQQHIHRHTQHRVMSLSAILQLTWIPVTFIQASPVKV